MNRSYTNLAAQPFGLDCGSSAMVGATGSYLNAERPIATTYQARQAATSYSLKKYQTNARILPGITAFEGNIISPSSPSAACEKAYVRDTSNPAIE